MAAEDQELAFEDVTEEFRGSIVVAVSTAVGFGNNFVDDAEIAKVGGHDLHGNGSGLRFGGIAPDDGSAALGGNNGVKAVFENVDAIADSDSECATGAAFAGDGDDDGNRETGHFAEIAGNGFALAAFFSVDAGISAGSVDEGEHGAAEFCGELHDAESFAIAFGLGLAKIANHALLGVSSLLLADDGHRPAAKLPHAGDERLVVTKTAVSVQLNEVCNHEADPVQRMGTLRVPGDLSPLPRTEMSIELAAQFENLVLEALELSIVAILRAGGEAA